MTDEQFVEVFKDLYEHSSWIAESALLLRPFSSPEEMLKTFQDIVSSQSYTKRLNLIREHPELGSRLKLSNHSSSEQQRAGLQNLTQQEFDTLQTLNKEYQRLFEFPFIIAVRGLSIEDIIRAMKKRLLNSKIQEFNTAIDEIHKIAAIRLQDYLLSTKQTSR